MLRLLNDAIFSGSPRTLWRSLAYVGLVLLTAVAVDRRAFLIDAPVTNDTHALMALEQAQAWAYCGHPSVVVTEVRVPYDLRDRPELRMVALSELVVRKAGSMDAYCALPTQAVTNNENSLMLTETVLLRAMPNLSARGLGRVLHLIRIAGIAMFLWLLIDLGGSLGLALAAMFCGLEVLGGLSARVYSLYPFLSVLLLVEISYYGFALKYGWTDRAVGWILCGLFAGVFAAFTVNMRSSYFWIVCAFFGCFLLADAARTGAKWSRARHAVRVAFMVACFVVAFSVFQWRLITRHLPPESAEYATHIASHSLVIALGVPETDFSRQLGITWLDAVGERIALQMDPKASYLGPRYNAALSSYYESLWREYPRQMITLYVQKFSTAGAYMLSVLRASPATPGWVSLLLFPLSLLPNGLWLLAFYGIAAIASLVLSLRTGSVPLFVFALMSLAASLLQVESGVIFSLYAPEYHSYLQFFAMFLTLLGAQALVSAAGRLRPARGGVTA